MEVEMPLHDLMTGQSPSAGPGASGLGGLVRPAVAVIEPEARPMSLPAALNARARGEIVAPAGVNDGLAGMMPNPDPLPQRPAQIRS